ncbi:enhanced serine sensitivity protein SseB [Escherichia coli]|nr:enhanced serine sensitivity protein SseB [Escherichia coli]HAN1164077.1 enhanced serine sensitivity protein SseB [Escherichia coli]HAN1797382.1 enhanced serine sensitivity protein SseB [Escherichia coli]HBB2229956.1 enhanced serine sensitivity protein SseB [Escherichia coli]HCZ3622192.1 enhanced serine sensitivity protein SseB [Escherichia coli]
MSETKNELEDLLEKAATEPAHRPAFFRTLLESTVWVPGTAAHRPAFFRTLLESTVWVPGTAAQGEAVVEDSALDLQHWEKEDGTSVIPFFTSLEALQQAVEDEQAFVVMPVRTLFEMTLGETLFLNAKLPTGKEFMPREISLLIGEEGNPLSSQEILEGGESLILSEVAEPPAQMIDSLTTLFKTIKPVKRAFICSIKENEEAQPNLLIGIEADGDIEEIIQVAGSVATDTLPGDEPIDICQVKKGEKGISHFITEHIAPFYERRWGGFLRDFKQNRII